MYVGCICMYDPLHPTYIHLKLTEPWKSARSLSLSLSLSIYIYIYSSVKIFKKPKSSWKSKAHIAFCPCLPSPLLFQPCQPPAAPAPHVPPPPSPAETLPPPCSVSSCCLRGSAHGPPPSLPFLSAPRSPAPPPPSLMGLYLYHLLLSHL